MRNARQPNEMSQPLLPEAKKFGLEIVLASPDTDARARSYSPAHRNKNPGTCASRFPNKKCGRDKERYSNQTNLYRT